MITDVEALILVAMFVFVLVIASAADSDPMDELNRILKEEESRKCAGERTE